MTSTITTPTTTRPMSREKPYYRFAGSFTVIKPIGPVADGFRLEGHFAGPITEGDLAGASVTGVDYFRVRDDGVGVITAHELIEVDGQLVAAEVRGLLLPPEGVRAPTATDIMRPDFSWPSEPYTIHASATFITASPSLQHLNRVVVAHSGTVNFVTGELDVVAALVG